MTPALTWRALSRAYHWEDRDVEPEARVRDILFTIASAGTHPVPMRMQIGKTEAFIDADRQVAVQFFRDEDQMVARVLESRDARVNTTFVVGSGVLDLRATLRHA